LLSFLEEKRLPMHIPGHKGGLGAPSPLRDFLGKNAFRLDLTEIAPLDHLLTPKGIIKEALDLASEAFGADRTFFVINGTTGCILAMILASTGDGDEILISRASHRSAIGGLVLSGASPRYIESRFSWEFGFALPCTANQIKEKLDSFKGAKALFLTSPNYYGVTIDVSTIVSLCHERGVPVLVDEAHGAHFIFHEAFPPSSLEARADLIAQSAHKTLSSLTQSSLLHFNGGLVDLNRVQSALQIIQTTSPSYLLSASLDASRWQMVNFGKEEFSRAIELANFARKELNQIEGISCITQEQISQMGDFLLDPLKLTINFKNLGVSGREVERWLREEGVEVELSDPWNVLCMISIGDSPKSVERLIKAMKRALRKKWRKPEVVSEIHSMKIPGIPEQALTPREAFQAPHRLVPLKKAIGKISSEIVAPYPPGIPVLCPGEKIEKEIVHYLEKIIKLGLVVHGLEGEEEKWIRVVA
jgi:arginine/lysine/ornithine decarboxylase